MLNLLWYKGSAACGPNKVKGDLIPNKENDYLCMKTIWGFLNWKFNLLLYLSW
jgi:hypothetical protein